VRSDGDGDGEEMHDEVDSNLRPRIRFRAAPAQP
jgi:hypothetical protein